MYHDRRRRRSVSREDERDYGRRRRSPSPAAVSRRYTRDDRYSRDDRDDRYSRDADAVKQSVEKEEGQVTPEAEIDMDEETQMRIMMGFDGFDSTKGKKVADADISAANISKPKRKYKQFMNKRKKKADEETQ